MHKNLSKPHLGVFSVLLVIVALVFSVGSPVTAHEAHRQNQTEQEIAIESSALEVSQHAVVVADEPAFDVVDFLGRLHPAAVHFPIALLFFAAIAELALLIRPTLGLERTVGFLVWSGALTGIGAVILGWFAGGFRLTDRSETLFWHRWNGTALVAIALIAALIHARKWNRNLFRLLVFSVAIALIVQGYLGGELALGPDHLNLNPKGGS